MLAHCSLTAVKPIQGQVRSFFIRLLFFPPPPLFFSYMFSGILPFRYSILEKNLLAFLQIFPISSHPCKNISSIASTEPSSLLLCQKKNPQVFDILNRELSEIIGKESGETHSPSLL